MRGLFNVQMPLMKKGHKVITTNNGPGHNLVHLLHPDSIRAAVGSGNSIVTYLTSLPIIVERCALIAFCIGNKRCYYKV